LSPDLLHAGRVGRPHGLDGSFHVVEPAPGLLVAGAEVWVGDRSTEIVRRAGTDERPILRVELASDRAGAEALRGQQLSVPRTDAPPLEDDEYWAEDLVGCTVVAGERPLGTVQRLLAYPSCEVLELDDGVLVPMVRDAIRAVDLRERRIEVDDAFLGLDA
jgi:16S rRNA processing protein RimM